MYSRVLLIRLIAVGFFALSLAGCKWELGKNLRFGEGNPEPGRVALEKFSCWQFDQNVADFLDSKLSEDQIRTIGKCVRDALTKFKDMTHDGQRDHYRPVVLANFFNREYLGTRKISPELLDQLMNVKPVFLGGDNKSITRSELTSLIEVVAQIEDQAVALLPHLKVYTHDPKSEKIISKSALANARSQIRVTGNFVGNLFRSRGVKYPIESLAGLIREVRLYLRWAELRKSAMPTDDVIQLVRTFKNLVTSSGPDAIYPLDWPVFADSAAVAYGLLVNYRTQIDGRNVAYGAALDTFISSIHDIFDLFERVLSGTTNHIIEFEKTDAFLLALENAKFLPAGLRVSSLMNIYKHLISKGFQNPLRLSDTAPREGLGLFELGEMRSEFSVWSEGQKYLSDNARRLAGISFGENNEFIAAVLGRVNGLDFSKFVANGVDRFDWRGREVGRLIKNIRPLYRENDARVVLLPADELADKNVFHSLSGLTRLNLMNSLARLLIRSFAQGERKANLTGITEDEMNAFYRLTKPLGEDLKLMDPRKNSETARHFIDAKVFTFSGDGFAIDPKVQSTVSQFQLVELLALMWSGGQVGHAVHRDLVQHCKDRGVAPGEADVFGIVTVSRECFYEELQKSDLRWYENMPRMVSAIRKMSPEEREAFILNIEKIARNSAGKPEWVEDGEAGTLSAIMHFVETLFVVYDVDKNDVLSSQEAMRAFKRFSGYLARKIRDMFGYEFDVAMLKAIYAFIIQKQEKPGLTDLPRLLIYRLRYFNQDLEQYTLEPLPLFVPEDGVLNATGEGQRAPEIEIDRLGVLNLLRILSETTGANAG